MYLNPIKTRLSDTLLLSDVMGCDSVYRYGFRNRFEQKQDGKLHEGITLGCFLDEISEELGPYEVCYGFISPELSTKIVHYQNPQKPSYHRWDLGAAIDVCFNAYIAGDYSPIEIAYIIDDVAEYSRMITYAESEWICVGVREQEAETGKYRRAFYENKYTGKKKPQHTRYPENTAARAAKIEQHTHDPKWRGQGWPSYHGKGRRQYEHYRVSKHSHVGTFLYSNDLVYKGISNNPPIRQRNEELWKRWWANAHLAGSILDAIADDCNSRVSVIQAYDRTNKDRQWNECMRMTLVAPVHTELSAIMAAVDTIEGLDLVIADEKTRTLRITGTAE